MRKRPQPTHSERGARGACTLGRRKPSAVRNYHKLWYFLLWRLFLINAVGQVVVVRFYLKLCALTFTLVRDRLSTFFQSAKTIVYSHFKTGQWKATCLLAARALHVRYTTTPGKLHDLFTLMLQTSKSASIRLWSGRVAKILKVSNKSGDNDPNHSWSLWNLVSRKKVNKN